MSHFFVTRIETAIHLSCGHTAPARIGPHGLTKAILWSISSPVETLHDGPTGADMPIDIEQADLNNATHRKCIVELLDMYSRDSMGSAAPLPDSARERLIDGLRRYSGALVLLAWDNDDCVGLCICFEGFSTFQAQPLLNIHDIAVLPDYRGQGIGRRLLTAVENAAKRKNCCKITLEVRLDNPQAQGLYQSFGFRDTQPPMHFWHKPLES